MKFLALAALLIATPALAEGNGNNGNGNNGNGNNWSLGASLGGTAGAALSFDQPVLLARQLRSLPVTLHALPLQLDQAAASLKVKLPAFRGFSNNRRRRRRLPDRRPRSLETLPNRFHPDTRRGDHLLLTLDRVAPLVELLQLHRQLGTIHLRRRKVRALLLQLRPDLDLPQACLVPGRQFTLKARKLTVALNHLIFGQALRNTQSIRSLTVLFNSQYLIED